MHCCKNNHHTLATDPRFEGDDFTQAALRESRVRAAHAHGLFGLFVALVGGMFLFGLLRRR